MAKPDDSTKASTGDAADDAATDATVENEDTHDEADVVARSVDALYADADAAAAEATASSRKLGAWERLRGKKHLAKDEAAEGAPTVESLQAELETMCTALAEATARAEAEADRALWAAAEAENARKRAERSVDNAHKFALERFVDGLLPAVDSFEQAVEAASAPEAENAAEALVEGVRLALKLLAGAMERQGVAVVDPIGAPFDPKEHEAMSMVENAEVDPGSVTQVFQKGYTLNGRLVRPARVIVARAPEQGGGDDAPAREGNPQDGA